MAPPSKISQLPQDLRDELIDRIMDSGFADYDGHHAWLLQQIEEREIELEDPISRSAIARVGKRHKSISKRMQEIRAMEREFSSDPVHTNRTTNQMLQMLAFAKTRDAYNGSIEIDADYLKDMALTIGRLEKAAAINEDRERDIREDERQRAREDAAAAVESSARQAGVSAETVERIRRDVLGME
jgi:hypothetical protein